MTFEFPGLLESVYFEYTNDDLKAIIAAEENSRGNNKQQSVIFDNSIIFRWLKRIKSDDTSDICTSAMLPLAMRSLEINISIRIDHHSITKVTCITHDITCEEVFEVQGNPPFDFEALNYGESWT